MKIYKLHLTVLAFLICVTAPTMLLAQAPMTLHDCMVYALDNSLKVKMQELTTDDARLARRDAILNAFTPGIDAGASAQMSFGRTIDPETNTYVTTATFSNNYSVSGGIYIFNGFSAVNNIRISKTSLSMGADREKLAENELCLATMQAYYNVVYYQKLVTILEDQIETANSALTLAVRQEELGQKGYADVVEMEAELASREYQLVNARNMYNDALITLKDLMFWPMDQELVIDVTMADKDFVSILTPENETDGIVEYARENMLSIAIARKSMQVAGYDLKTAKWRFAPSLYLSGGWSTGYYTYPGQEEYVPLPFWNQLTNNQGEWVGVSLSFPIYNRLGNLSNLRRKRNAYTRARMEYQQKQRDVESEVRRAVQDRDGAAASFRQAERRATVQEESYHLSLKQYEQGLISALEFQTASDNWLNAKSVKLDALLKYYIKCSVVNYYNGIDYIEQ